MSKAPYVLTEADRLKGLETRISGKKPRKPIISNVKMRRMFVDRMEDPNTDSRTWVKLYVLFEDFKRKARKQYRGKGEPPPEAVSEAELADMVAKIEEGARNEPRLESKHPSMTRKI